MKPTEHPVRRPFPEALAQRLEARFGKRLSRAESIRAHHGHDESHFPDAAPDAVVFVHSTDEVAEVVCACGEFDVPLIPFGVGSSLEGHILATRGGVSIDFSEMNKVLDIRAVGLAKRFGVPVHVRSTFTDTIGTWVVEEDKIMESLLVSGITYSKKEARITIKTVPDQPGIAAKIFLPISDAGILVDMIIQNTRDGKLTDMTFTVPRIDYDRAMVILKKVAGEIGAEAVTGDRDIAKVSIVGVGMRNHPGIASTMFQILAKEGINMMMVSTSEIKVSCIIAEKYTELAVRSLHDAFALDKDNLPLEDA